MHVECLNRWRQTSVTSYYRCSVCSYEYQLRRTVLADVLMSEYAAIAVTLVIILAFALASGVALDALWSRLLFPSGPPLVSHIYRLADIDIYSYRRCSNPGYFRANYSRAHDKVQFLANWAIGKITCSMAVWSLLDKALVGSALLGCCAFSRFFLMELLLLVRLRGEAGGEPLQKAAMLLLWLLSLGNRALSRLAMVIGTAIAGRELFNVLIVHGRALSQIVGEQILEPSHHLSPANGHTVHARQQ